MFDENITPAEPGTVIIIKLSGNQITRHQLLIPNANEGMNILSQPKVITHLVLIRPITDFIIKHHLVKTKTNMIYVNTL